MDGLAAGLKGAWEYAVPHITDGANPAAGASFAFALDGRYWWRLQAATFTLSTDSNAANRFVSVQVNLVGGGVIVLGAAAVVVTASTTNQRFDGTVGRGDSEWNTGTDILFPLADFPFLGGRTLSINIGSVQAGDQLSLISLAWWRLPTNESIVRQYLGEPGS
jgi:hypothetical protein